MFVYKEPEYYCDDITRRNRQYTYSNTYNTKTRNHSAGTSVSRSYSNLKSGTVRFIRGRIGARMLLIAGCIMCASLFSPYLSAVSSLANNEAQSFIKLGDNRQLVQSQYGLSGADDNTYLVSASDSDNDDTGYSQILITDSGVDRYISFSGSTVSQAIAASGIEAPDDNDIVVPALTEQCTPDTHIIITRISYDEYTAVEVIPFITITIDTPSMSDGERNITVHGSDGEKRVVYQRKWVNGELDSETVLNETITKEAVSEVVEVGVSKPGADHSSTTSKKKNTTTSRKTTTTTKKTTATKQTASTKDATGTTKSTAKTSARTSAAVSSVTENKNTTITTEDTTTTKTTTTTQKSTSKKTTTTTKKKTTTSTQASTSTTTASASTSTSSTAVTTTSTSAAAEQTEAPAVAETTVTTTNTTTTTAATTTTTEPPATTTAATTQTSKATTTTTAEAPVSEEPAHPEDNKSKDVKESSNDSDNTFVDSSGRTVSYTKVLRGKGTAYNEAPGSLTATGREVAVGLVAVDPKVIPYNSKLYIVSADGKYVYGYCVAADTGGALRSGSVLVDLFYNSEAECNDFGRRDVIVYIL